VIKENPGITIPELAKRLRIRPNYLYRVTGSLEKENRVRRRNRGFHAT
jgi:DNA-binding MarR family transcriptional regulator